MLHPFVNYQALICVLVPGHGCRLFVFAAWISWIFCFIFLLAFKYGWVASSWCSVMVRLTCKFNGPSKQSKKISKCIKLFEICVELQLKVQHTQKYAEMGSVYHRYSRHVMFLNILIGEAHESAGKNPSPAQQVSHYGFYVAYLQLRELSYSICWVSTIYFPPEDSQAVCWMFTWINIICLPVKINLLNRPLNTGNKRHKLAGASSRDSAAPCLFLAHAVGTRADLWLSLLWSHLPLCLCTWGVGWFKYVILLFAFLLIAFNQFRALALSLQAKAPLYV